MERHSFAWCDSTSSDVVCLFSLVSSLPVHLSSAWVFVLVSVSLHSDVVAPRWALRSLFCFSLLFGFCKTPAADEVPICQASSCGSRSAQREYACSKRVL